MENHDLFELASHLSRDGALLCFTGSFSQSIIEELGNALRKYLELDSAQRSSFMDVFSVYIEAAQNVRNYGATHLSGEDPAERAQKERSIVVIAKEGGRHVIRAGNAVHNAHLPALLGRLSQVAALDRAGLRALYKEQLKSQERTATGGAGLGLIEMARKATSPLAWATRTIDDRFSFFSLHVTV